MEIINKFFLVAKTFSEIDNGFRSDHIIQNGWIVDQPTTGLLFWVPPWSQIGLWRPNNVFVIGKGSTKVDLSHFVHGTNCQQCQEPLYGHYAHALTPTSLPHNLYAAFSYPLGWNRAR